jgi:hypothetical protein
VSAFSADAETAEKVRFIVHVATGTVRAQVLHTIAGVLKRSSKVEALGIFVAAIKGGEVEDVSGLLGNLLQSSLLRCKPSCSKASGEFPVGGCFGGIPRIGEK